MGNKKRYSASIAKVGEGVDDKILALMMHGAINADEGLLKALYGACDLQEATDVDYDSNK